MALDQVANFIKVEVSIGYDDAAVEIVLKTDDGAKLPEPATGNYNLVWHDSTTYPNPSDDPNVEIVRVTAKSTDTLTVTRNQESSGASTKNTADKTYKMILSLTKKMIDDIEALTGAGTDTTAIHDNVAAEISAVTEKTTPVAADLLVIEDSAASNAKKRLQIGNLPNTITAAEHNRLKDNILMNAFRIAINGSLVKYNMIDGIMDEFEDESGVDTGASTNEDYDSANDLYSPAGGGAKATGGVITYDGDYVVHTFSSDGTFTPASAFNVEYLVVAGGGSGGCHAAASCGGGGAGGLRTAIGLGVTAQAYGVTVGAGGAAVTTASVGQGNDGEDSVFSSITSAGGGGGGEGNVSNGRTGGSSGGGGYSDFTSVDPTPAGQGNRGGDVTGATGGSAGGGGKGAVGAGTADVNGGAGGVGEANSITGGAVTYAGGGGGGSHGAGSAGAGGTGGGGAGGVAGTDGLGGGGGGQDQSGASSGAGGSGVVIIKYLGGADNMTLVSESTEAEANPDNIRMFIVQEDVDAITVGTDIKAYCSRTNGAAYLEVTLTDEGDIEDSGRILSGNVDVSGQTADSTIRWKVETLNNKDQNIKGVGLLWN